MSESQQPLVIYHKDCTDGTTAAAVVLKKFPLARAFPLAHHYAPADLLPPLDATPTTEHIYTVDCALGVQEFLEKGYQVTTIDHHISVKENLEALASSQERFTYIFNNEKSGASLSWSYFFPDEAIPEVITFVEDSDLWLQRDKETPAVTLYLSMLTNQPKLILPFLDTLPPEVKAQGKVLVRFTDYLISRRMEAMVPLELHIGPHTAYGFNVTEFQSQTGNLLSQKHNAAVALFAIQGNNVRFSFRSASDTDQPSALELAQILGGGGHLKSAGARISLQEFLKLL